jgi:hypothetical protein
MWDSSNLYLLVDVTDDVKKSDTTTDWFNDDGVAVFVDGDGSRGTTYDGRNDQFYVFGWNRSGIGHPAGTSGATANVVVGKSDPSSTRYRVEVKIPWSSIGVPPPTAGRSIGLDVHVYDDDNGGAREGKLMWSDKTNAAGSNPSVFGTAVLRPPLSVPPLGDIGTGLKGQYFNNKTLTGSPVLTRTDREVNFGWGTGSPGTGVNVDGFSARWTGKVEAPVSGGYTFFTRSDDGIRLWVNNQLVINNWTNHAATDNTSAVVTLAAGQVVDLRLEYFDNVAGAEARLYWSYPGQSKSIIPARWLHRAA